MNTILKAVKINIFTLCVVLLVSQNVSGQIISTIDSLTVLPADSITSNSFHLNIVLQPHKLGINEIWLKFCVGYDIALDSSFQQIIQTRNPFLRPVGCVCLRGCSVTDCDRRLIDSNITFDFTIAQLLPNTRYFYRVYYSGRLSDYSIRSRYSTTASIVLSSSLPRITPPMFRRNTEISDTGFRLAWDSAYGSITHYLLDVATDSTFKNILPAYSSTMVRDTQFLITNLAPSSRYFYRVRSANAQRVSVYSRIGQEYTLPTKNFRAEQLASSQPVLVAILNRVDSTFYRYSSSEKLTIFQIDSLLNALNVASFVMQEAYIQSAQTCTSVSNGRSEVVVKLRQTNNQIGAFGFDRTGWSWASDCDCPYFRAYNNFVTTSVVDRFSERLNKASISPNPASDIVSLRYTLSSPATVQAEILDMLGRTSLPPVTEERGTGEQSIPFSVEGLSSGVYSVRLTVRTAAGMRTETVRLVVFK
jgi:Secretion system C-terminal sorting domain/Fibronectin type III domain